MGESSKIFQHVFYSDNIIRKWEVYVSVCDAGKTNSINTFHVMTVEALITCSLFLEA
jgi:hypothetical protein